MKSFLASLIGFATVAVAGSLLVASSSCSQTPVNVPVRTFDRPQKVDFVCMRVLEGDPLLPTGIPAEPQPQAQCAQVPPNVDGSLLFYHLYALVTQTTRGELAVVDLTAGTVVDIDRATPGINFLPVGALPTDVAVTPDGAMTFVAAAEPNKPAIYAMANRDILGDAQNLPAPQDPAQRRLNVPKLTSWPVCQLPQTPGPMTIVPRSRPLATAGGDAGSDAGDDAGSGAADAGNDAGVGAEGGAPVTGQYDIVVVLPGDGRRTAKVVTIDPAPFVRGVGLDTSAGATIAPGSLAPCVITSSIELSGDVPASFSAGPAWDDGVKYVPGGVDLTSSDPAPVAACTQTVQGGGSDLDSGTGAPIDAGADATDGAVDASDDAGDDSGAYPVPIGPDSVPHAVSAARDGQTLYVADNGLPIIHVIDLSTPGRPRELAPLLATSLTNPARKVAVGQIAVSPATRDYQKFLYAIDQKEGSLIVYDVTDPATSPRSPLTRPHPELNPFQPGDRLIFNVPVASITFARHDIAPRENPPTIAAKAGLLCNPNPNVGTDQGPFSDPGAYYRANVANQRESNLPLQGLGPARLRGIFALATLSNGQVLTIDVDDWDAPCRRPDPMDGPTSAIAPAEPGAGAGDTDPYHVPKASEIINKATVGIVSTEAFFPVSAPHRPRSAYLLRRDPTTGVHIPNLIGIPQLFLLNAPITTGGAPGEKNPLLLPPSSTLPDPSYFKNPTSPDPAGRQETLPPGVTNDAGADHPPYPVGEEPTLSLPVPTSPPNVRFSWEDPQVHIDQDWSVTYEGALPGFEGITTQVTTADGYQSLTLAEPQALFCRRGVEDLRVGSQRAAAELAAFTSAKIPPPANIDRKTGDYIEVTDDLLDPGDPYWTQNSSCWDPGLKDARPRYDFCSATFGAAVDESIQRDFPILEAYDDRLVVGRFGYPSGLTPSTTTRVIVSRDPGNAAFLKAAQCCFHNQVHFKVRTGGVWVAVGSSVGYLHHMATAASDNSCVPSCELREQLLNARAPGLPRPVPRDTVPPAVPYLGPDTAPDRNSVLAMRNPMFSFLVWNGATDVDAKNYKTTDVVPTRDLVWRFTTRGQFVPQLVNLAATTTALSPQSMRFIESLQQVAVIDGSSQGLVLIDLDLVAIAHAPYF